MTRVRSDRRYAGYVVTTSMKQTPWGMAIHLAIDRIDGKPIRCGWDTLQQIKNDRVGEDSWAVEVFPAQSDLVDEINRRHLWVIPPELAPNLKRR